MNKLAGLAQSREFNIGLWACAFLLYGLGDLITTNLILMSGGRELNPVLSATMNALGSDFGSSSIVKVIIFACLAGIYAFGSLKHRFFIPVIISVAGAGLVVNNYLVLISI